MENTLADTSNITEEISKVKSAFFAGISHEIRTPMNVIVGFSNLLSDPEYSEEQKNYFIKEINQNSKDLLRIIDNLIFIAEIESGEINPEMRQCNVEDLVKGFQMFIDANKNNHILKDIQFHINFDPKDGKLELFTDPDKIQRAFISLAENVCKFSNEGKIEFGIKTDQNHLVIYLRDIHENQNRTNVNRLLQKVPGESQPENVLENGLGLTLADKMINAIGGKLKYVSILGKESSFFITIPLLVEKPV